MQQQVGRRAKTHASNCQQMTFTLGSCNDGWLEAVQIAKLYIIFNETTLQLLQDCKHTDQGCSEDRLVFALLSLYWFHDMVLRFLTD